MPAHIEKKMDADSQLISRGEVREMVESAKVTPMPAAALVHKLPLSGIERYTLVRLANNLPVTGAEDAVKRADFIEQVEGSESEWCWDVLSRSDFKDERFEEQHEITLTKSMFRYAREFCDTACKSGIPGRQARWVVGIKERINTILDVKKGD